MKDILEELGTLKDYCRTIGGDVKTIVTFLGAWFGLKLNNKTK